MPMIVLCGHPCSGKTTRANELKKELESYIQDCHKNNGTNSITGKKLIYNGVSDNVVIVNDESIGQSKSLYGNGHSEKIARAALFSAVERELSKDKVVIVDGLNYIKGYRYQLYCVARAIGTPSCVIQIVNTPSNCLNSDNNENSEQSTMDQFLNNNDNHSFKEMKKHTEMSDIDGNGLFKRAPDMNILKIAQELKKTEKKQSFVRAGSAKPAELSEQSSNESLRDISNNTIEAAPTDDDSELYKSMDKLSITAYPDVGGYGAAAIASLISRFEDPDARNRWDAPLFIVTQNDILPMNDITEAILHKIPPRPNLSTVVKPLTDSNYVYELERGCQKITEAILERAMQNQFGSIVVPGTKENINLNRSITRMELNRIRKQWLKLNTLRTERNVEAALSNFVSYVNFSL